MIVESSWKRYAFCGVVGLLVGLSIGGYLQRPVVLPAEPPAPSFRQDDGSLGLERGAPTKEPPPHILPKSGKEERRISVVVKPQRGVVVHNKLEKMTIIPPSESGRVGGSQVAEDRGETRNFAPLVPPPDSCDCPPVTVDLSVVRMPDKTRRVIASSPDGKILTGVDIPIELERAPRIPRWALSAIAVGDINGIRPGALVSRRAGPIVLGGGILSDPGLRQPGALMQFGLTW